MATLGFVGRCGAANFPKCEAAFLCVKDMTFRYIPLSLDVTVGEFQ
jgi:hypothetical protein